MATIKEFIQKTGNLYLEYPNGNKFYVNQATGTIGGVFRKKE